MNNVKDVLTFIKPLDGWLSEHEGYFLYEAARKVGLPSPQSSPKGERKATVEPTIVEIGSWKGKSTICLASGSKAGKKQKVTAIDPHLGKYSWGKGVGKKAPTYKEFLANLKKAGVTDYVVPLVTTSQKAAKDWKKPIGLLFIDGLHDYVNAYNDFSLWNPFVVENGTVAFHDAFCGHKGSEEVISKHILYTNLYKNIGVVGSIIYIQKGKPTQLQKINILRHRILLPLTTKVQNSTLPQYIKFFLIHRIIKLFLLNKYTLQLVLS